MRLAAIDIGTNSVHMIVVQVRPDLSFEVVDREKDMVRLGAGGLDGRRLTDAAISAGLQALSKFKRLADSHGVDEIIAGATSATREAENGGDFLDAIVQQTGIRPRVISGPEEARLIHMAAAYGTDLGGGKAVVVDIGGGSVEVTLGGAAKAQLARSFKLGVIRLTERFVKSDPVSARDERRLVRHVEEEAGTYLAQLRRRGFQRVIGTSGTILSLGGLAAAQEPGREVGDLRGLRVTAKLFHKLRKALVDMDLQKRLTVPGLDPRRADLAVGGVLLFDTILRALGAKEFVLCDLALREGLVLDYIRSNAAHIAQVDRIPDVRRRSAVELAGRCRYQASHTAQVTRLALSIFDQTAPLHELGAREREWLEYAGLLHDIGLHISHEGHHRHSHYLIKHGDLRGFDPDEIDVIALVARYHRSGKPKKSDRDVARLRGQLRRTVQVLSAILSLAEGLDRSHAGVVSGVTVDLSADRAALKLQTVGDAELEAWAAARHLAALEKALQRPVQLEAPATPGTGAVG
jgi:exopolyphosphatase/guanosine-5'-triphosphate,3'-diphosphate pyrophosphatase